jgi:adenylate cyclase class 2
MKEIEVKILGIDKEEIEKKLVGLGARKIFDGKIDALHFDFKDNSLRKKGDPLRLRKFGSKNFLTFKKKISKEKAKIKEETEIEVSDFEDTKKILGILGLNVCRRVKKHRISYGLEGTRFELDTYEAEYNFVPSFLEIEAKDVETIYKFAKILGFSETDCKPWSTSDVIKYYQDKK